MNRYLLIITALVLVLLVALGLRSRQGAPVASGPRAVPVTLAPAVRGRIAETTVVAGTLQPLRRVELTAQLPSRVLRLPVTEGATVAAGTVVVQLDEAELRAQIARAGAGVAVARANLQKARLGEAAASAAASAHAARARGGTQAARAAAEQATLGVELTRAQAEHDVAQARAGVEAASANASQARTAVALARAQASAEIEGAEAAARAAEADVERATQGAVVSGGAATADLDRARAGVAAAEANLARVKEGASPDAIAAARSAVDQARAGRDHARAEVEDLEYLHANGGVSGDQLAGARTQLRVAEAQLAGAEAQLRQATAGASAAEMAAVEAQVREARAGLAGAEAAAGRGRVSAAEVAAANAQLDRARAGLRAAQATRDDRLAVAEEQARAAGAALEQARAGLVAAEAARRRVAVGQAQVRAAEANVATARAGEAEAAVARREAALRAADIAAAQAGLVEAEAQERLALQQLQRSAIASPVSGVVTQLSVGAGDTVLPGMPLAVIETAAAAELEALATIAQRHRIQVGQRAVVRLDGAAAPLQGTVREVADVAEADGRSFKIRIVVNAAGALPGVHATATIETAVEPAALLVPAAAVQDAEAEEAFVYRAAGSRAQRQPVTIGLRSPEQVQIIEGLGEGEQVITDGAHVLYDGAPIEPRTARGAPPAS